MDFEPDSRALIGAAIEVHRLLGPGLLESVYRRCLTVELRARGILVASEVKIPLVYRGVDVGAAYRVDLILNRTILVEIKSVQKVDDVHRAQLLTYLKITGIRIGFLLNFNTPVMRAGITRMVL